MINRRLNHGTIVHQKTVPSMKTFYVCKVSHGGTFCLLLWFSDIPKHANGKLQEPTKVVDRWRWLAVGWQCTTCRILVSDG